jgi:hypothetical protein
MVNAASAGATGFADMVLGIMALEMFFFLDPQSGTGGTAPSAQAPFLNSALELLLPLGVAGVFAVVAYIYRHLSRRHAAANMRIPGLVIFILSLAGLAGSLRRPHHQFTIPTPQPLSIATRRHAGTPLCRLAQLFPSPTVSSG